MLKLRHALLAAALLLPAALVPAPASAQEKITIGVSLAQDDNPFYIAMLRGIRARAQNSAGRLRPSPPTRTRSSRSTACRTWWRAASKVS